MDRCLSFVFFFSFGHFKIWPSIYGIWLRLWFMTENAVRLKSHNRVWLFPWLFICCYKMHTELIYFLSCVQKYYFKNMREIWPQITYLLASESAHVEPTCQWNNPSWSWSCSSWIYNYLCNKCLSSLPLGVRILLKQCVLDTTISHKVCQWLAAGRWFSPGTPVSSINKTDRHDIAEILLKVALNTMTLTLTHLHFESLMK